MNGVSLLPLDEAVWWQSTEHRFPLRSIGGPNDEARCGQVVFVLRDDLPLSLAGRQYRNAGQKHGSSSKTESTTRRPVDEPILSHLLFLSRVEMPIDRLSEFSARRNE
jgi:hypothetical protein